MPAIAILALLVALLGPATLAAQEVVITEQQSAQSRDALASPDALLIQNSGQFAPAARFMLSRGTTRIWLTDDALWLVVVETTGRSEPVGQGSWRDRRGLSLTREAVIRGVALRIDFETAGAAGSWEPYGRQATRVSYLVGNDPAHWQAEVPVWSGARLREVAPGLDLVLDPAGDARLVPWRVEARPGADVSALKLRITGARIAAVANGKVSLETATGALALGLPLYSSGAASISASGPTVTQVAPDSFELSGAYSSAARPSLTQSPGAADGDLFYSTYLGGTLADTANGVAVDSTGAAFIAGDTLSLDLPTTTGAYQVTAGEAMDAYAARLTPAGNAVFYLTYLGGSDMDRALGIAVEETDGGPKAHVAGETFSSDFTATAGVPAGHTNDIFALALNASGTALGYASLFGGTGSDYGYGIAVEGGYSYVVGETLSSFTGPGDPPTVDCSTLGEGDMLVLKFDAATGNRQYAACAGGTNEDIGFGIAAHGGQAYVTGMTYSDDFTTGSGGSGLALPDVAVAIVDGTGTVQRTVLSTDGEEYGNGIAVDAAGNAYVTGITYAANFPIVGGGTACNDDGWSGAFVAKLTPAFMLTMSTCLGGTNYDEGFGVKVGSDDAVYVTGATASADFPVTAEAYQPTIGGGVAGTDDAFLVRMVIAAAPQITYATFLGGQSIDRAYSVSVGDAGFAYLAGLTTSSDFPVTTDVYQGAWDGTGLGDAFVARLLTIPLPGIPVVNIAAVSPNALLSWGAITQDTRGNAIMVSNYQVWRSARPYFVPGDASSPTVHATTSNTSYPDSVLADMTAYYYIVRTVSNTGDVSPSSNRVGKFTFPLVKGQ